MIEISIFKNAKSICKVSCSGHSGYAKAGQDIVCSAVSTLTQNAVNSIEQILDLSLDAKIDEKHAFLEFELPNNMTDEQMSIAQILLQSMLLGLKDIEKSYGKYLLVKEIQR